MTTRAPWLLLALAAIAGAAPQTRAQAPATAPAAFQVGDRVLLRVEREEKLTDTFTVVPGPALELPDIGLVSLAGVRRSDLEPHLTRELSRYLKNPVVYARALVRLGVLGEVAQPGFYAVPVDLVFADALMLAGGPTREAKMSKLRIERGAVPVWQGEPLRRALAEGRTIDGLGLQAGDRVIVPHENRGGAESTVRILGILVTIPAAIYGISRIF